MANGSDGSIIIDTELDNSGVEKGKDNIDINALTDMLTQQQYAKLRNFGGV